MTVEGKLNRSISVLEILLEEDVNLICLWRNSKTVCLSSFIVLFFIFMSYFYVFQRSLA
jgi:hypothetical protein